MFSDERDRNDATSVSEGRMWLPVLQDRMLLPFLGWDVVHEVDRSQLRLGDAARLTFTAVDRSCRGLSIDAWVRTGEPHRVLEQITSPSPEWATCPPYRGWWAQDGGIAYSELVSDAELRQPQGSLAVSAYLDRVLDWTCGMMDQALEVTDSED